MITRISNRTFMNIEVFVLYITFLLIDFCCCGYTIRPKLCTNALGKEGTCMFVWECIKTEGKHLGTCADGFLFGSCCEHNDSVNSIPNIQTDFPQSTSSTITTIPSTTIMAETIRTKNKWTTPYQTTTRPTTSISTTSVSTLVFKPVALTTFSTTSKPLIQSTTNPTRTTTTVTSTTTKKPWISYTTFRPYHKPPFIGSLSQVIHAPQRPPPIWFQPQQSLAHTTFHKPPIFNNQPPPLNHHHGHLTNNETLPKPQTETLISSISSNSIISTGAESSINTSSSQIEKIGAQTTEEPSLSKSQCGITQVKPKTKVVGGKNSAFGAWPWQVSVRRTSFFGFSSTHRCGGAILNSRWVATAGHCVDDLLLTQIRIRVGEYDFSSALEPLPYIERGAKKKIVHPRYNFFTYENDLALVQLDEPLEFLPHVSSICLPPDNVDLLGKNATVTGWGRLSEGGVLPTVLQEVRVPIVSNDKCKNMFLNAGRHEYIPDIFMCAGFEDGGHDSCQGDSGGPLQVQGDDGRWFLAGIISWGIGCGEPSLPGVCTRISKFKQWISNYITEQ